MQDISLTQCNNGKYLKHDFETRKYSQQNNNKYIKLHQFAHKKKYEVLLSIDANEHSILHNNGVSKFLQHTKLIDIIDKNYRLYKASNTLIRGRHRIDYFFCIDWISSFIDRSVITSFNEITSSDHRGIFLDLRLQDFPKNSYSSISKDFPRTF